jgi:hypothetical protein
MEQSLVNQSAAILNGGWEFAAEVQSCWHHPSWSIKRAHLHDFGKILRTFGDNSGFRQRSIALFDDE